MPAKRPWQTACSIVNCLAVPKFCLPNLLIPEKSHPFSHHFQSVFFLNILKFKSVTTSQFPFPLECTAWTLTSLFLIISTLLCMCSPLCQGGFFFKLKWNSHNIVLTILKWTVQWHWQHLFIWSFFIYIHTEYYSIVFLHCKIFGFGIKVTLASQNELGSVPSSSIFGRVWEECF